MTRTFVDRGGTFTDVVHLHDDSTVDILKVPSDRAIIGELARGALVLGTTVATNALLEGSGVETLLLVSEGFGDLVRIGDMTRPELFDPDATRPAPLCTRVVEVRGRLAVDGREVVPLVVPELDLEGIEAVAVALLHGGSSPEHELRVAEALRGRGCHVVCGHEVSPEVGYLQRIHTTLVDAAITPVLREALQRDRVPPGARAMRSDGSLIGADRLRAPDAVLSGPAGGVLAVAHIAEQAGFCSAIGLDMGGTSTDLCRVDVGALPYRDESVEVGGARVRRRSLEVETIAAGGGSVLRSDGRRLTVGPDSAGASPGPACYGRGGPATLTDAALLAGLVAPSAFDPPLVPHPECMPGEAEAFLDVAREAMAGAVRRLASARGVDLRDHALVAYGGAAGQHAAAVAARLGVRTVLVHPCAAVLCAFGQSLAPEAEQASCDLWIPLGGSLPRLEETWSALAAALPELGDRRCTAVLRYQGTDHGLEVIGDDEESLAACFNTEHRRRYGFARDLPLELVRARVEVSGPTPRAPLLNADPFALHGATVAGPHLLTHPTTAVHVPAGWTARMHRGLLWLQHDQPADRAEPLRRTPLGVELWSHRFMGAAEEGGEVLRRLARSVNVRERLDFSVAVFDARGQLVANAPHIPVHLGAMGETVRDLLHGEPHADPGTAWLTNDPAAGGSHLPDLTVITVAEHDGARFFVASRAHHVDVGGVTPGSMPPHSVSLLQEGRVYRRQRLQAADGTLDDLADILTGLREPTTVRADLLAQLAANAHVVRTLIEQGSGEVLACWMNHLLDVSEETAAECIATLRDGRASTTIDDVEVKVAVEARRGLLHVDFTGTGGPHPGNRNAPSSVVRAAILYVLRVLSPRPLPLSEGALRRVRLTVPPGSLLDPPPQCAVVGGNVETSQQLVDLLFAALSVRAGSQGTMNNLTLGAEGWAFYETLGGGGGATAVKPGSGPCQQHMTNTRGTDPEVLERRVPVRVWQLGQRHGSGGRGQQPGGDGLVRELELLAPARASLLASHRDIGGGGLHGGHSGAPGEDHLFRAGTWAPWDGATVTLDPGDRVRIRTPGGGGWGRP